MKRSHIVIALCLLMVGTFAHGQDIQIFDWMWEWQTDSVYDPQGQYDITLTRNNGSHAVAMGWPGDSFWTCVVATSRAKPPTPTPFMVNAYDWWGHTAKDACWIWWHAAQHDQYVPGEACVAANDEWKLAVCSDEQNSGQYKNSCLAATATLQNLDHQNYDRVNFTGTHYQNVHHTNAGLCLPGSDQMVAAFDDSSEQNSTRSLDARITDDAGDDWVEPYPIDAEFDTAPSLAAGTDQDVYAAFVRASGSHVLFRKSTNYGATWLGGSNDFGVGTAPCVAAVGQFVFVCWVTAGNTIAYSYSNTYGINNTWSATATIGGAGSFSEPNVAAIICYPSVHPGVLLVCKRDMGRPYEYFNWGEYDNGQFVWKANYGLSGRHLCYPYLRPSIVTAHINQADFHGANVYNSQTGNQGVTGFHLQLGEWGSYWI